MIVFQMQEAILLQMIIMLQIKILEAIHSIRISRFQVNKTNISIGKIAICTDSMKDSEYKIVFQSSLLFQKLSQNIEIDNLYIYVIKGISSFIVITWL